MPEQKSFFEKNWQALLSTVFIPVLMWVATTYEERGRIKAELEYTKTQNEILDKYLDVSDELAECLGTE